MEIVLFGAIDMVGNGVPSQAVTCGRRVTCGSTGQAPVPAVTATAMKAVGFPAGCLGETLAHRDVLALPPRGQRHGPNRGRSGHRDRPRRTRRHPCIASNQLLNDSDSPGRFGVDALTLPFGDELDSSTQPRAWIPVPC
ncbi:hypothetical protein LRD69_01000 [Streptomyces sp. JH14]|uniref:hypothetical protein n=1 Tax=Streptomyces sp. JH14 TaxID=2793630 RepID=UPI0023F7579D|nr:hypothetical protein [Streptomyces sp. JH14]MDF6040768.1 hypothetical protein [Streptomyces sp. JH14]